VDGDPGFGGVAAACLDPASRVSGGSPRPNAYRARNTWEHDMRKFHSIAALCGDGLRPELQALFERLAIDPDSELFVRQDGMVQSGPDPDSEAKAVPASPRRVA
jgi:hypothetical protein